jgi:hypothetical protein
MDVDFDGLRQQIVREIDSYVYAVPPDAIGDPCPEDKVQAQLDQLRQSLVSPYLQSMTLRDTTDQITAIPPNSAEYIVVADDGEFYLVFYDPQSREFGLAQPVPDDLPVTIGVRGDVVGVFMAR